VERGPPPALVGQGAPERQVALATRPTLREETNRLMSLLPPVAEPTAPPAAAAQDDRPLTVIERKPIWGLPDFAELWRYRELLFFLTWRDVKLRYKQTLLGAAWAVLQPLAVMVVFSLFFGRMPGVADDLPYPYSLFVFAGLLPWTFFSSALASASQSVVGSQNLVTKIYFPRLLIPLGAVGAHLIDLAIAFVLLLGLMLLNWRFLGLGVLLLPVVLVGLLTAALGVGILLAALTVAYRDFRFVVPFLVQLWMFATPCIYMQTGNVVGPVGEMLLPLNPAYGLIVNFRQAVLGGDFDWYSLGVSGAVSVALLALGIVAFRRMERTFADII
jgi:lipopolysaccharide transport system permease protein